MAFHCCASDYGNTTLLSIYDVVKAHIVEFGGSKNCSVWEQELLTFVGAQIVEFGGSKNPTHHRLRDGTPQHHFKTQWSVPQLNPAGAELTITSGTESMNSLLQAHIRFFL